MHLTPNRRSHYQCMENPLCRRQRKLLLDRGEPQTMGALQMTQSSQPPQPSRRRQLLDALELFDGPEPGTRNPKTPKPPKPRFLPGESRATCGVQGFREINPATFRRQLYANDEPRNLVPPQYTVPLGPGDNTFPASTQPCAHLHNRLSLAAEHRAAQYINRFLTNLLGICQ